MLPISPGLEITILWDDAYLTEVRFSASNGVFSGVSKAYIDSEQLLSFAKDLQGFPKSNSDERIFSFGAFDETQAGGGARLRFFCLDGLAHIGVEVELRSDPHTPSKRSERCTAILPLEPAAIDQFTASLRSINPERGITIRLPIAT